VSSGPHVSNQSSPYLTNVVQDTNYPAVLLDGGGNRRSAPWATGWLDLGAEPIVLSVPSSPLSPVPVHPADADATRTGRGSGRVHVLQSVRDCDERQSTLSRGRSRVAQAPAPRVALGEALDPAKADPAIVQSTIALPSAKLTDPIKRRVGWRNNMTRALEDFIAEWRRERPDLNLSAFSIAAAIKQIDQQTEAEFRRVSASLGIGPGDLRVLFALRRSGVDNPRRPTDLFQSLLVTSGAITKQLDRLEAQGFVDRSPDPSDQRGFLIHLTRRGVKVADAAIEAICSNQTTIGAAIAALSEEERAAGARFLQRLLAAFEEIDGDAGEEPPLGDR
jgi:DNA-binding MarR family transcriptional regulator